MHFFGICIFESKKAFNLLHSLVVGQQKNGGVQHVTPPPRPSVFCGGHIFWIALKKKYTT